MSDQLTQVVCIRITQTTYDKIMKLKEKEQSTSEITRECLIRGVARMESEKK